MAKDTQKRQINVRLDAAKDQDIIEFLEDRPVTWIVRQALREYMANNAAGVPAASEAPKVVNTVTPKPVISTEPVKPQPTKAADPDDEDPFAPVE